MSSNIFALYKVDNLYITKYVDFIFKTMKKLFALLAFISLSILGCVPGLYEYHNVSAVENPHFKTFELYVDKRFTREERLDIANAVNEINYVLNGAERLEVKDWAFEDGSDKGKEIEHTIDKTHQGLIIFALSQDDERIKDKVEGTGILAFVNGVGKANLMVVITDRIGNRNLKTIVMHELCHFLGASHVNSESIMYPYASEPEQVNCVDKSTVAQIAHYQHIELEHLNWCKTNDFN